MTPEERDAIQTALISAIKELGEIAECIIKEDERPDHWKQELCDLCGLAIQPMLDLTGIEYYDACAIGVERKRVKTEEISFWAPTCLATLFADAQKGEGDEPEG